MSELALYLIAENKKTKAKTLDLGNCGLTEIPKELAGCIWLSELSFSNEWYEFDGSKYRTVNSKNNEKNNNITTLSATISTLKGLKRLWLSGSYKLRFELSDLSPISELSNLEELYIGRTSVNDLGPVKNLINLKHLSCNYTKINDIQSISNLKNLIIFSFNNTKVVDIFPVSGLENLEEVSFSKTDVSDISPLKNLIKLEDVFFESTKVEDLSPLSELTNLKTLFCNGNAITELTPIRNLKKLEVLDFSNTLIHDITPLEYLMDLSRINCANSQVSNLLPLLYFIKKGSQIKWGTTGGDITIENCPITTPPLEIVKQGNLAILKYFEEFERAKQTQSLIQLTEAKCLILGEGGAGKTSLTYKLLNHNNPLPEEKETTKGINIHPLDWQLPDGTNFHLNIWDFGGQEIYHATHQFFLTKRSLYILLDDTRKDEKTVNDPTFNYWLQIAELYGGSSPLLIVQNEKGDRSKELDLRGMQGRFSFVRDVKATNLLTCRGLDKVWETIEFLLKQLPHIGEEQPKAWLDIRREMERLAQEEKRDHISLEEYYRICTQHTIPERERALFLSGYLHDFGVFLHFQDHPLLRKILIINNQWATDAVYKVLDCESVKKSFGRFTRYELTTIWSDSRYEDQHEELLALMEKFEICYKLPDEKIETWIAPQLLSVLKPETLIWAEKDNMQVRYEYEFMPKGLLSQHIVRMHRYIRQPELAWKSGVVFERADSQAIVTEAWGSRKITLRARGVQAKELLTLLSEDFDKMHERLEGLKVRKMIPCNCRVCDQSSEPHFYGYEELVERKANGKQTVECKMKPYEDVSVTDLLDGVFAKGSLEPLQLLESGQIEEALRQLQPNNGVTLLLSQFCNAEREFQFGQIDHKEFEAVKNRVIMATLKLVQSQSTYE